jgi:hypothetical protein
MNNYARKTNFGMFNTNTSEKKGNSYQLTPKRLYKNNEAVRCRNQSSEAWNGDTGNISVHNIINNFKGTLVDDDIKIDYKAFDIFPVVS